MPDPDFAERELVRRARAGDQDAFGELVGAHADRVYGALRRFGLGDGEAEEVAQEVFLRAWRGLDRFEERARFSTWLYRIAFNESQPRLSRHRLPTLDIDPGGDDPIASLPDTPGHGPEARALDREFDVVLDRALAELPAEQRTAVVLRDLEGLSTEAAAEVMGIRQAAFKSRLHRGRMQLRTGLMPYLDLQPS